MLFGEKIYLRPLEKDDYKLTIKWRNDMEITPLVISHPFPITEEMEKSWFENVITDISNKRIYFSICEKSNNENIGMVFLSDINWINRTCYFHILIGDKSSRGKGYGKEVLEIIINYVFHTLNLRKITLQVVRNNKPAISLYEKKGFKIEGELKKQFFWNDRYYDVLIMSLFKE